ncbi:hypothetical protein ACFYRC_05995 [Streptomyces sp. NPDC005279]|uniref:hypothetical protein n=1 Tax=Streptomyces sp. NPDC005279 TaxID=3364712 RepID=UPI003680228A
MAITVGSVEVDVVPNTRGIHRQLTRDLVAAGTSAGTDAGDAAGQAFGPAMTRAVSDSIGTRIGEQIGSQISGRITANIRGAIRDGINQGGAAARPAATRQGGEAGGAFGRTFRTRVEAALRSLPDITIGANTGQADADIRALRVQLETLASQRIGIDIDAATARRQVDELERELTRLGARHPDIAVRINTAAATGELAALRAEIARLDGQDVDVDVNTHTAAANLNLLTTAALALGPAILPVLPLIAAGLGAIAAAGVAAGVGIGAVGLVAIPAIKGIGSALQAQKQAQDAATSSTNSGAGAAVAAQQRAIQMAGATQALAAAERNGARQIAAAQDGVTKARQQAGQVAAQAAQRSQQAARQVQDAERQLTAAQRDAKRAQEDLTAARKSAADQLRDLNDRLTGAALDERAAVLQVRQAQDDLNRTKAAGSKATQLDKDQAQLAYDQAVQGLKDQQKENARLKKETAAANKAGVEGSDTVRAAHERLAQAQQQVADRARAVRDAQAEQARTQVQNAQDIATAQQRIVDAQKNVTVAQQSAADSIASAQRQIASAQQQSAGGADAAAAAQAKYRAELAKLTPAARGTFNAFTSLKTAFGAWSRSLQPQVMPIFTRALDGMRKSLPGLTPFVLAAAKAISGLQDRVSKGFKSPWWKEFKSDLAGSVGPAITGLGISFGRIFKGMAGIIQAFLPHMNGISGAMQRITGRFANWGTNLKGSPAFESFLRYSAEMGPKVAEVFGKLGKALFDVGHALSPIAGPLLAVIGALFDGVSWISSNFPFAIQLIYGLIIATRLWAITQWLMNGALTVFSAVFAAGPWGWAALAIAAIIVVVVLLYQRFEWFRTGVQAVWDGIKTAIGFVWESVLKPAFSGIWTALKAVGAAASWLWNTVLSPVFGFIGAAARILATIVLTILIVPFVLAFKLLAAVATWVWNTILSPIFGWIGDKAVWLWQSKIKPAWDLMKLGFQLVADKIKELWDNYARPIFQWIGDKAAWLWSQKIKPAWDFIKVGIGLIGDKIRELWDKYAKPVFNWIGDKASWLWDHALKPAFDNIKKAVGLVADSFGKAKDFIGKAWNKLEGIAKKPVRFIIDKIYNGGIVPTWNKIASAFGAPEIHRMETKGWATGGVLPGYTPGRDPHKFYSPTGGGLELSGGEAIMRPEWTRAVGSRFVATMNKIASSRGATGVKAALAPALGGNPTTQQFADGGIFGWIGKKVAGAGSAAWDGVKKGASWLSDTIAASARAGLKGVVDPLLKKFPGAETDLGKMLRRIPTRILDSIFGYSKTADKKGAGGVGGPKVQRALTWARSQAGKPYEWGGVGPAGYDCSGFMSAIQNVLEGRSPYARRWATGAFSGKTAAPGWVLNGKSPFQVGITNAGVGHTAGTLGKVNVESRGGDGVVVGKRARGAMAMMFQDVYGYRPGSFDAGGYLPEGLSLAYNGTGRPEPVLTGKQAGALMSIAAAPGGGGFVDGQSVTLVVQDGPTLQAYVSGVADRRVEATLRPVASAMRAGRKG